MMGHVFGARLVAVLVVLASSLLGKTILVRLENGTGMSCEKGQNQPRATHT